MNKKGQKKLNLIIKIYGEKTLEKIDGFDNAIIGVEVKTDRLIYSVKKCLEILKKQMPTEEAIDHFYMDIFSGSQQESKVIFCEDYLIKKPNI
jgi:hypothetical protein